VVSIKGAKSEKQATFTAKGKTTRGPLYRNLTGRTLLITSEVGESGKFRTYLLGLSANRAFVKSCGDWVAEQSVLIINRTIPPPAHFQGDWPIALK
jgi:hypothetical protein